MRYALDPTGPAAAAAASDEPAVRIVERLLRGFPAAAALRLWNGTVHALRSGQQRQPPAFTLVLRDPALLRRLIIERSPLLLADAYFRGRIDVEGDLYSALGLKDHFQRLDLDWRDRLALLRDAWRLPSTASAGPAGADAHILDFGRHFSRRHSRYSDQAAVSFHYDVSNAFYGLWLDEQRVYSCAYFRSRDDSLEQAQRHKLDLICRKLRLRPGERLLDVGCGWGALVCWAARHYGVRAHGITLSREQLGWAERRIRDEGLADRASVELRDYRDLPDGTLYDKVASVGMFEHVGLKNLPAYYATVARVLRAGGLFLNHGITHDEEGWNRTVTSTFINRYVFPDGELDRIGNIVLGMERAGFEIHDVEGLRRHYALTLRHWVRRLEARRDEALREAGEPTWRVWRLYMAACALEFEQGATGVHQILASRRGAEPALPLTRDDLWQAGNPPRRRGG